MERKRTRDIIISAVIAIILWFYLINIVNPQKDAQIKYVPVSVSGVEILEERGLAIAGDLNFTVNLSIVGARNDVSMLTASDFTATADVASLNRGTDHIIVKVAAPRGIAIEDIDTDNIEVVVEDFVREEKPISIIILEEKEGTETTVLHRSDDKLIVSGAKSDVDKVECIAFDLATERLDEDISKTIILPGSILDASSNLVHGVKASKETISADAVIYKTKTVQLKTDIVGEPLNGELAIENYEIQPVISIKGSSAILDKITSIKAEPIDISGIDKTTRYDLKVNLPEGVYLTRDCPELKAVVYITDVVPEVVSEGAIEVQAQ